MESEREKLFKIIKSFSKIEDILIYKKSKWVVLRSRKGLTEIQFRYSKEYNQILIFCQMDWWNYSVDDDKEIIIDILDNLFKNETIKKDIEMNRLKFLFI